VLAGLALLIDEGVDMGWLFDLRALVVTARAASKDLGAIEDAHLLGRGHDADGAPHMGVRQGVIVEVEAGVWRLADIDGDRRGAGEGNVRQ